MIGNSGIINEFSFAAFTYIRAGIANIWSFIKIRAAYFFRFTQRLNKAMRFNLFSNSGSIFMYAVTNSCKGISVIKKLMDDGSVLIC